MRLVNFIYSDEGSNIIENSGYVPVITTLVIATIPERSVLKQEERYRPLIEYLYKRLGSQVRIRLKHLSSYEQVVDEFMGGKVNAAFLGSFTYALARAKVGVTVIARPEKDGVSQYRGLILIRKDSGIESWKDLRGRRFAMIEATTAGEIFPKLYFKKHGVKDLRSFLGEIVYVGSHDDAILKVLNGEVDAAAAKDLIFYKLMKEIPRLKQEIRILATGFPVPENALTIRKDIDIKCYNCHAQRRESGKGVKVYHGNGWNGLESSLRSALLDLDKTEEGKAILEQFGADRFVKTTDEDYHELYESLKELGMEPISH
jgi:phosphonate transport system substrate-binding protein